LQAIDRWEMQNGTLEEAERHIRQSIKGFEDLDVAVRTSDRSIMFADILVRQGRLCEAEECLLPSLECVERELGQLEAVARGYACVAHIRTHQSNVAEAERRCTHAKQIYDKIGMKQEVFPIGLPSLSAERTSAE